MRGPIGQRFYADMKTMQRSGPTIDEYANLKGFEAKKAFRMQWASTQYTEVQNRRIYKKAPRSF
eukprot:5384625-Alexandrium_andersonii.AAC.1